MALKGNFDDKYKGYTYKIVWSASQNVAGNYSEITCTHTLTIDSAYTLKIAKRTNSCTVNGDTKTFESAAISKTSTGTSKTITLGTTKHTVKHKSDGSCSISISGVFNMKATIGGAYNECITVDGDDTLNTITRNTASTFGKITGNTIGSPITVEVVKSNSSLKHRFGYRLENGGWITSDTKYTDNVTFTPSTDLLSLLSNSTSGMLQMSLATYDTDGKQVGSHVYKNITVYVSGVSPTIGGISCTPAKINDNNVLVQGKNSLTITASSCSAGTGSTIKSYTFSGPGVSATSASNSFTVGSIPQSGNLTYTVTVTDARGSSVSDTKDIVCYEYKTPSFLKFTSYRCDENGTEDEKGTSIKCEYKVRYSSVNNTNSCKSIKIYGGPSTETGTTGNPSAETTAYNGMRTVEGSVIISNCSLDNTYNLYASFTDQYGGSVVSSKSKTYGASKIMNIPKAGNAIAFGKKSTTANTLDSAWPISTDDPITTMKNLTVKDRVSKRDDASGYDKGNLSTTWCHDDWGYVLNLCDSSPTSRYSSQLFIKLPQGTSDAQKEAVYFRAKDYMEYSAGWIKLLDENNCDDYIIEQKTSGNWTYRKWKKGFVECFGYQSVSNLALSTEWGSMHFAQQTLPNFPVTFASVPNITLSWSGSSSAFLGGAVSPTEASPNYVNVYAPKSGVTVTGKIIITATGQWK